VLEYPVTVQQQRMLDFLGGRVDAHYLNVERFELHGRLDLAALRSAVGRGAARHDAIRSVFPAHGRSYRILPATTRVTDAIVRSAAGFATVEAATVAGLASVGAPLALDREPPLRVWTGSVTSGVTVLLVAGHYLVFDAWSFALFYEDLAAEYGRLVGGGDERPRPPQYHEIPADPPPDLTGLERLFERRYSAVRALAARSPGPVGTAVTVERTWTGLGAGLRAAAKAHRVTPFVLGSTAVLHAVANGLDTPEPFAGSPYVGRTTPRSLRTIGYFATTLFVGLDTAAPDAPVGDVDRQLRAWYARPRLQWEDVLERHGGTDLYAVKFAFLPGAFARPALSLAGLTTRRHRPPDAPTARRALHLVAAHDDDVTARLTYRPDTVPAGLPGALLELFGRRLAELQPQPEPGPADLGPTEPGPTEREQL
jgi:hypothetical protein